MKKKILRYLRHNIQFIINLYLFANFLGYTVYQTYQLVRSGTVSFVEISFIAQNIVLTTVVIIRSPHKTVDRNAFHQLIALVAFFSGAAFMGQNASGNMTLAHVSTGIILAANILGFITLLNLGKSFGILIALRRVKSGGAYGVIRHPMYLSDILLRCGFLVSHFNAFTVVMFVLSSACYVYRAILEERHLSKAREYREYMKRVRYRFIPFVF